METRTSTSLPLIRLEKDSGVFFRCVEDSNEAIMISDTSGRLVYVNPAWRKIYGYSAEEALGQTPRILHSGFHSPKFYAEMWEAIADPLQGYWKGEILNRSKSGQLIPVLLSITLYKSPQGDTLGFMGTALDLSYRKELEAKVAQQDRLASVGLLASGLAHEIGTPLGVIRGRAEFIMMQAESPTVQKYLEVIVTQIDRISKLIRSLLRISRAQTDMRLETVQIGQVITEVLSLVGEKLRSDHVDITVSIPDHLEVYADFNYLEQVLLNLVINSAHAIQKAIKEGRKGPHQLILEAQDRGNRIALTVRDTGCGISPENMKKLFKPFFTTKAVGEGTGLGLAIIANLLHEMGGGISAESTLGEGTVFTVLMEPKKEASTQASV